MQQQTTFNACYRLTPRIRQTQLTPETIKELHKFVNEPVSAKKTDSNRLYSKLSLAITSLGLLLYRAIFYKKIKEMERRETMNNEIERISAEIQNAYETRNGNFDSFKEKTDEMNQFIKENIKSPYYARFVENAIKFLQEEFEQSQVKGDINYRFTQFMDDKGIYYPRYNKFMWLLKEYAKEAVNYEYDSKYNTERDWYKFDKDAGVAYRIMRRETSGLNDENLNGDTYPGNIYGFTQEEPDIGGFLRLRKELEQYESKIGECN